MKIHMHSIDYDKLLSITFACILFVTGIICISAGFIADEIYDYYRVFTTSNLLIMSYIISIAGLFTVLAALLCLVAAYKRDQWVFITITLFFGLSITMELAASIDGISFNKNTRHIIQEKMHKSMKLYGGHRHSDDAWNYVQNQFTGFCAIMFIRALLNYMEHKRQFGNTSFLKKNLDVFTVEPLYSNLEK